jgi:nucleoside-diphosphate-sugar epimerase
MFSLEGKNALVTGATGGIGEAIARALHAQGATVPCPEPVRKSWKLLPPISANALCHACKPV